MSEIETLRHKLIERGVLPANAAPFEPEATQRPWFVSIVLGCAGWLAGIFGLVFLSIIFSPDTAPGLSLMGAVLLAAAYGLYAVDRENAFLDQLALALSIAGQLALAMAAWQATHSAAGTAAGMTLLQVALVLMLPNRLAKLLSTFFACIAWALSLRFAWWGESAAHRAQDISLFAALIGWLVIWAPIAAGVHILVSREARWLAQGLQRFARPILSGLLISLTIGTWVSEPLGSLNFWRSSGETNWLALWPVLGTIAALFAATCAFRVRNHALVGVAIVGALAHVVQFYFLLGTTLLAKSAIMLTIGIALTLTAVMLEKRVEVRS